ncbi:hypothetical protein TNCT_532951 [Trichonephila clavata]|uniref:Uncharacterized protein n=1 Tax=Trichonephila clavata TaxID=2740835 RepID=A0A8X6GBS0_TRICU|nr:hypothetical protein TNCT_708621 [Trichonephila clavata]GFR00703.1 hypothetical protein TNCT_368981 [Trichonephila clavata]GFR20192.1 hypothetical protein TNCT_532951 [Trichonephila clavata]
MWSAFQVKKLEKANKMEPCSKNVEETVERGIQRTNHGKEASPREFYPMNPIQRGTCLKTHVSFQGHRSNGETPRRKFKEGNSKGVRKTWKHPSSHQRWKV